MTRCQALILNQDKFGWTTDERTQCRKSPTVTIEARAGYADYGRLVYACNDDRCRRAVYSGHFIR